MYTFWGFDNSLTPPIIVYRLKGDVVHLCKLHLKMKEGELVSAHTTTSHVRYDGDTTLQSIIDNNHAIYLWDPSSSGSNVVTGNYTGWF